MKNLEAAKELLERYRNVTLEELKQVFKDFQENYQECDIIDGDTVLNVLTGFGDPSTCLLCKAVNGVCEDCVYSFRINEENIPCLDTIYNRMCNSETAEEVYHYLQQRISYLSHVIEWYELNH